MDQSSPENHDIVFTDEVPPNREKLRARLAALGSKLSNEQFDQAYARVCRLHDLKHNIYLCEICAIIEETLSAPIGGWTLIGLKTTIGGNVVPGASVVLKSPKGKVIIVETIGESSIDAVYSAIQRATRTRVFLRDFTYGNITSGINALGRATVKVERHGKVVSAQAYSVDIIEAAARAFLYAINIIGNKLKKQD